MSDQGRYFEANELLAEAVATRRRVQGDAHPEALTAMNNLAALYKKQGDFAAAQPLYRETLDGRRDMLGNRHPDTLTSLNNLATLLQAVGTLEALQEAEVLLAEAAETASQAPMLGPDHPHTKIFAKNLDECRKKLKGAAR